MVDGLARAASAHGDPRHAVVVERSTFQPRYESADVIEYAGRHVPAPVRQFIDPALGRLAVPRFGTAEYFAPLVAALRAQPPSIVLAHNAPQLPWLLRNTPHRVVLYAHNELLRTYSRPEATRALRPADGIVCVSRDLAERTRAAVGTENEAKVHVVGNGVDTARFTPRMEGPRGGPMRVMFVGRVVPEKGVDTLLRSAAGFARSELEIVVVGSAGFDSAAPLTDYETGLRALAARSNARVEFRSFVDRTELPELLRSADVLCVPSRWPEPSGLTLGEGLASGVPVVASRVGGIPEAAGPASLLVTPDDPAELAATFRRLLEHPERRREIGWAGRRWAEAHDWSWAWGRLREVLDAAVPGFHAGSPD
ncbi:glycosyltransferase involved in cell wall biosynthesis [Agromyces flavus]|uniref:Glycosyltransferase involved in cell wall biosynthesis n=1 Tax=Agromyces flavus TaxID=589382 RepID=A0ABT1KJ92_9MICO|nr:glycosyltransferase family 4 protein [Agromyces flavus]MCP2366956.1 glycosyltransferase involved in cell wall biosynthesis [Agromyces flavus]